MNPIPQKPSRARFASVLSLLLATCALLVALPAAAVAAPEEGSPAPQLNYEPGSYDFGLQRVYESSQTTMQLRNSGEGAVLVNYLDVAGPGSGAFWLGSSECNGKTLAPGEACSLQVNFNPYDAQPFEAEVRAHADGGSIFTAGLSGEGGRALLAADVDPVSFGATAVGSPGVTKAIEVTNFGNLPGGVFIAVISGGAVGSFQLLDENCTGVLLHPGSSCTALVRFQPISTGVKTARLSLFGDQDGGAQVTLTGVGVEAEPAAAQPAASAASEAASQASKKRPKAHRKARRHRGKAQRLHRKAIAKARRLGG